MTTKAERTRLAAELLQCPAAEVQAKVRAMSQDERQTLTNDIDRRQWVAAYEAQEVLCFGKRA